MINVSGVADRDPKFASSTEQPADLSSDSELALAEPRRERLCNKESSAKARPA